MSGASIVDVAPFIAGAFVVILSPIVAGILTSAVSRCFDDAQDRIGAQWETRGENGVIKVVKPPDGADLVINVPMVLHKERVRDVMTYLLDSYQAFAVLLIPTVGVFFGLPKARFGWAQVVAGIAAIVLGAVIFTVMQGRLSTSDFDPSRYLRYTYAGITPIGYLGLLANGAAAFLVYWNKT